VRKTDTIRRYEELFQFWRSLFPSHLLAAIPILLLGVSVGRAEPFSFTQSSKDSAPTMSAWGGDSSSGNRKSGATFSSLPQKSWRSILGFDDKLNLWNPQKNSLFNDQSPSEFASVSSPRTISVPAAISDAALELESIPMDDPISAVITPWEQAPEDMAATRQLSESAAIPETSPRDAAPTARHPGESLDFSVPEAARGPSKVDFSLARSEGVRADSPQDTGSLSGAADAMTLPPTGPISQIASPEPSVTALWGVSAALFAGWRRMRSKS
jgi:hypothetical protein